MNPFLKSSIPMAFCTFFFISIGQAQLLEPSDFSIFPKFKVGAESVGRAVQVDMDRDVVASLLPNGLELAQLPDHAPGKHPVTFMIVEQNDFAIQLSKDKSYTFGSYNELAFAIHDVKIRGAKKIYWYFLQAYADSNIAVGGGSYFGYPKAKAEFTTNIQNKVTASMSGQIFFEMSWKEINNSNSTQFKKNLELVQKRLDRPMIAERLGKFICTQFKWNFSDATIRPLETQWSVSEMVAAPIAGSYDIPGLDTGSTGGYFMKSKWSLYGPLPCSDDL
jgi:hypothetical protein